MFHLTVTTNALKQMKTLDLSLSSLLDILLHGTHTQLANGKWLALGNQKLNTVQCQYTLTNAPEKTFTVKTVGSGSPV